MLFEARKPRETAIIAEINGQYGEISKGYGKVCIVGADGEQREYLLPREVDIRVHEGKKVTPGEPLMDGPLNPHDILKVKGQKGPQGERHHGSARMWSRRRWWPMGARSMALSTTRTRRGTTGRRSCHSPRGTWIWDHGSRRIARAIIDVMGE